MKLHHLKKPLLLTSFATALLLIVPSSRCPFAADVDFAPSEGQSLLVAPSAVPNNAQLAAPSSAAQGAPSINEMRSPFINSEPRKALPFPILLNEAVQDYVRDYLDQPDVLRVAFERNRPFMPEMVKVMKEKGVPDDLVYLACAESRFSSHGKGYWQFTQVTAQRFGLRVDKWTDERRDPIKSTRAAAEFLAQLHDRADNDWRVALVGWNMGEGYLGHYWLLAGDKNFNKFAELLPTRTYSLLNRFMAVAYIAHNAATYGIGPTQYPEKPSYKTHFIAGGTLLSTVAARFNTTVAKLRWLNPALQTDEVPPDHRYPIRIPLGHEAPQI